jgi:hypothetical protein
MRNLIDETYFVSGLTALPSMEVNNGFDDSIQASQITALRRAISSHQKDFFRYILGSELYAEFISDPDAEKWVAMLSQLIDDENKVSPLANFVYCHFVAEYDVQLSAAGAVKTTTDNAMRIPVSYIQTPVWNEMCRMMDTFYVWLYYNRATLEDNVELSAASWGNLNTPINPFGL